MVREIKVRHIRNIKSIQCKRLKDLPNARSCSAIYKSGKKKTIIHEEEVAIIDLWVDGVKKMGYGGAVVKPTHNYKVKSCRIETTKVYWEDGKTKMFPTRANIYCWSD